MKKLFAVLLALALLLGCTAAMADPVTLTYAEVNPLEARWPRIICCSLPFRGKR